MNGSAVGTEVNTMAKNTGHGYRHGAVRNRSEFKVCLLYTSPSPRDGLLSRMPSSA